MRAKNAAGETIEITDLEIGLDELKGLVIKMDGISQRVITFTLSTWLEIRFVRGGKLDELLSQRHEIDAAIEAERPKATRQP